MDSGIDSSTGLESASSLELALDRATDLYRASVLMERKSRSRARARAEAAEAAEAARTSRTETSRSSALVVAREEPMPLMTMPSRLKWRGIEVTDEFQRYAARVARGEQLAPYRGEVLARPCPEFRWENAPARLLPAPPPSASPRSSLWEKSAKAAAAALGVGAALMAALGVGAGAAAPTADGIETVAQNAAPLRPYRVEEPEHAAPQSLDDELGAALAAAPEKPTNRAAAAKTPRRNVATNRMRAAAPRTSTERAAPPVFSAPGEGNGASAPAASAAPNTGDSSTGNSTATPSSRPSPAASANATPNAAQASTAQRPVTTLAATREAPPVGDISGQASTLFNDQPTF